MGPRDEVEDDSVSLDDLSRAEGGVTEPLLSEDEEYGIGDSNGLRVGKQPWWRKVVERAQDSLQDRSIASIVLKLAVVVLVFFLGYAYATRRMAESREAVHEMTDIRIMEALLNERYPANDGDWSHKQRKVNVAAVERLASCIETGTCTEAEKKVVILASYHFGNALAGHVGGENIWAMSTYKAFKELNHTVLIGFGYMEALTMYQTLKEHVHLVLLEDSMLNDCVARNETTAQHDQDGKWQTGKKGCIQRPDFLDGIPLWKTFAFFFWNDFKTPLGPEWTVSPEDYGSWSGNRAPHFLGYSIEDRCLKDPLHEHREHRALVLAKETRYFDKGSSLFVGLLEPAGRYVPAITDETTGEEVLFKITSTAGRSTENGTRPPDKISEPGVEVVGRLPQEEWTDYMARSKVLIGLGHPALSPSPYEAMCRGVPFINPIHSFDVNDPTNRHSWGTQHDGLKFIEEPYLYHVPHDDGEALANALRKAVETPIGRFIPEKNKWENVLERHRVLMANDYLAKCEAFVAEEYKDSKEDTTWMCMDPEDIRQAKLRIPH